MTGVVNLGRLLTETARRWPDRTGLVQGDRRWTWRQLGERVDRTVIALRRLDVAEGDRIVVQSRNNVAL
ncbi:MAG TPA: AMP-binding protein, partial [Geminicoccaceae bacterium]|nr:AMP-binding protein [Geminicoccaceae bacterium]